MRIILVELIVVLVILAILAAIMVPALTGWIDKAKDKQIVINARSAYLAAQTLASEAYGNATTTPTGTTAIQNTAVQQLAGVSGTLTGTITMTNLSTATGTTGSVALAYTEDSKKYAHYTGGQWVVNTTAPTGDENAALCWKIAS